MADPKKMSIEEMLAAARKADGGGGGAAEESAPDPPAEDKPAKPAASSGAPKKVDPTKMSVADMLAAARAEKSGGAAEAAAEESEEAEAAPAKPAKVDPKKMSVADMLAAARGETAPQKKETKKAAPKAKPAAKAAAKPKAAAAESSGPKDSTSILAAARKAVKPGPLSNREASERDKGAPAPAKAKLAAPPMPARPDYAQRPSARPAPTAAGSDRRGFIAAVTGVFLGSSMAVGFSSLAVTHVLWALGLARFMFPNILIEPPTVFKIGFPDDYAPGQVETKFKAQYGIWLVRYEYEGQPQIYAIKSVCTHLGCTPNWLEGEQKFKCPCHGSGFYKDGINFEGPAPRPLERYAIRIADDGQIEVDKSRKFHEELGQWSDSASFIPV